MDFRMPAPGVDDATEHKQQVAQTIEIYQQIFTDAGLMPPNQRHDPPFGTAADPPC